MLASWPHHIANISTKMLFIALLSLLTSSLALLYGDVESTPGLSYTIERAVLGIFNQSDKRFGHTAGIQCAFNSLHALCWSQIRGANMWISIDLDHVLLEGDKLNK